MVKTIVRAPSAPTSHVDTFAADNLPPRELWPVLDFAGCPALAYPDRVNAAAVLLDRWAEAGHADRPVLRFPGGVWTYRQLREAANRIANVLVHDLGLVAGNRVLLRGANDPMLAACWFAVLKAGGIAVTTMALSRRRELCSLIDKAEIGIALTDAGLAAELEGAAADTPRLHTLVAFNTDAPDGLEARMRRAGSDFETVSTAADDIAIIAFTSGTTGQPKGTMHFHRDILAITDTFSRYVLRPEPDDLFCGSPPLAFTFGLGGLLLFPMRVGAAGLLLPKAPPSELIQAIQEYRATVCFTAPTAYRAMAEQAQDYDIGSLRKCVSAGEALPLPTYEAWHEATGIRIIDGIGATEMLHIFISATDDDIRPGATGRPVVGYQARVIGVDGEDVGPGTVGRLAVRGPTGCRYLADPDRQREYVQNGWNVTGDAYIRDDDRYFWYQARTDDMIISAGYNIAGLEVESVLLDHPAVQECGVVGISNPERGQVVKAFVVLRLGFPASDGLVRELQRFVKSNIAPYKYPRVIEFVDALPRTETGKLQRFRLREVDA